MSNRLQQELLRPRKWFDLSESGDTAEFYIYDVIGSDFWGEGVRAKDFLQKVNEAKASNIVIHINSPGGDVFDGMAIYNTLLASGKKIATIVDGIAASAASVVFMGGSERSLPQGALLMIHNSWTLAMGDSSEMGKVAEKLAKVDDQIAGIYASCGKVEKKRFRRMMDEETFIDGVEARDLGLATGVAEDAKIAACAWDLKILSGVPEGFHRLQNAMSKRDIETALRDAGWSHSEAKRIAAGPRDAGNDDADIIAELRKNIEQLKTNQE